ncbi:SIS domain-containing protein [uncultured Chitinophaga sp.]|jgi:Phosphoheptose isomerase|uniref:D-sedoheptulose-7-phosphate isomerase n=1 Tax=uncultured Chitinophaga sp. TaxID=339340 RepID=UPI00263263D9|nr:D-sedoheptulose 7-phosphate isomerase [uncultured Chitinophaga sp.]
MSLIDKITETIQQSIEVKQAILRDTELLHTIQQVADVITHCLEQQGKVLFCGNGGSAADAQHLAAEFSGRFYKDRAPLYAEALHCNSSYLTAVGNDYGFEQIYARILRGIGQNGDVLVGISTSGNSVNILEAMKIAREKRMTIVSMTGNTGGKMKENSDYLINIPSTDTPRIQESHITVGHIICEIVENNLFGD